MLLRWWMWLTVQVQKVRDISYRVKMLPWDSQGAVLLEGIFHIAFSITMTKNSHLSFSAYIIGSEIREQMEVFWPFTCTFSAINHSLFSFDFPLIDLVLIYLIFNSLNKIITLSFSLKCLHISLFLIITDNHCGTTSDRWAKSNKK